MMKVQLIYITLWSLSQAAYISRMASVNRIRVPTAFRPGVTLQRPWHPRIVHAASNRPPYVIYRNPPQRYAVKHYGPSPTRNVYVGGPWKTTARLPSMSSVTPEYEFVRAASAPPAIRTPDGGTGAIHTIPAPNLSLSQKPIVVIDASENMVHARPATSEAPKPTYEVTEKYVDPLPYHGPTKIEQPIGFSKATSFTAPELEALVRSGASLQVAPDYGLSALALAQSPLAPQQFMVQGINGLPTQQELIHAGADGIIISPNALFQADPGFMENLQKHLLQRYPAIEFVPYAAETPLQPQVQEPQTQPHVFLLDEIKQAPSSFIPSEPQKTLVQREAQETSFVTLVPQAVNVDNVTEDQIKTNQIEVSSVIEPQNTTVEVVTESQPSTTLKYVVEANTEEQKTSPVYYAQEQKITPVYQTQEQKTTPIYYAQEQKTTPMNHVQEEKTTPVYYAQEQKTTPIYYAQVGQSVGNVIANGFYSAINEVRAAAAAAALAQVEKPQDLTTQTENVTTTTTIKPELKAYFVQSKERNAYNQTVGELKPLLGVPFAKQDDSVKVAYTILRTDNKEPKVSQDGAIYAGQLVEATISEDHDFNKEKVNLLSKRAPLRLVANIETSSTTTTSPPKITVVKAKIPPKTKLTFDDKTGEPVLRIYASYVNSPLQKEIITSKLANIKHIKEVVAMKREAVEDWRGATVKSVDKAQGADGNQVTEFGVKLRARSDDYIPLFEDYEE